MEERVSMGERIVLAIASVAILAALFLPWYSAYVEVSGAKAAPAEPAADSVMTAPAATDSLALAAGGDSLAAMAGEALPGETGEAVAAVEGGAEATIEPAAEPTTSPEGITTHAGERANQQIITHHQQRRSAKKDYTHLSGIGSFAAIGSAGSYVFSSGFVLIISGILMLVYALLCIALPVLNLYALFGTKGNPDQRALAMKKLLKLNWLPLIILVVVIVMSFFGASYGFSPADTFDSLGESYGIATVFSTLSWGIFVAMAAATLVAVKGIEI
jgi:hypothetical protein